MADKYHTVDQVAERFQCTRQTVYNWIKAGKLKAVKLGTLTRIREDDLAKFEKDFQENTASV